MKKKDIDLDKAIEVVAYYMASEMTSKDLLEELRWLLRSVYNNNVEKLVDEWDLTDSDIWKGIDIKKDK